MKCRALDYQFGRICLHYRVVCAFVHILTCCARLQADEFRLKDGRIVVGDLVSSQTVNRANPSKNSPTTDTELVIQIDQGVQITLLKSELALNGHRVDSPVMVKLVEGEVAYEELAKRLVDSKDTAENHYKMAQLLSSNQDLSRAHFQRAIELNPDLKEARAALKHEMNDAGRWERLEDRMRRVGKIDAKGRWKYPEIAAAEEQNLELEKRIKALRSEINRRHQELTDPNAPAKFSTAFTALQQLEDPLAAQYIGEKLTDSKRLPPERVRRAYIDLLGKFSNESAVRSLAMVGVTDESQPLRNLALDQLNRNGRELAVRMIIPLLRSQDNQQVNAAGYALGKLAAEEAVLDLIGALTTRHKFQIESAPTYSADGMVSGGPKQRIVDLQNVEVFGALTSITGQGTNQFDKAAWLGWYASKYGPPVQDLRRDP